MSERVVKVTVTAQVASYLAGMDLVAKKSREGRTEAEALTAKLEAQAKAFKVGGAAMLVAGGVVAAGLALAVKKAADFEEAMSHVQAATHESTENMKLLSAAAIDAGARTVFSATEAANAIEELAKAGVSTKDILGGGLNGALSLAAAGGLGVADAAGIAATTLQQFGLKGDQASHVADLLAAGAGKAMGDVTDLAQALNQGGLVANQFGLTVEETTGALSAFAAKGLLGSDAGTSFKTMLQRLVPQSKQAQQTMDALGLSAFDSSGNFVGLTNYAGKLHGALKDMSTQQRNTTLSVLFGSDAVRAATVLYDEGADGIQGWIDKVNDQGYAAETASLRLNNLKGDLEQLGGAFDSLLISVGESGQGPLRVIVQSLTDVINVFNQMPDGGKTAVFWVGAAAAAALLAGGTFLAAVPKIAAYKVAIAELGPTAQRTSAAIGGLAKALGIIAVVAAAVTAFDQLERGLHDRLNPTTTQLANALKTATSAKRLFDKTITQENLQAKGGIEPILKSVKELHNVLRTASAEGDNLWDWLNANTAFTAEGAQFNAFRDRWQALAKEMAASPDTIAPALQKIRDEFHLSTDEMWRLIELSPDLKAALTDQATQAGVAASKQNLLKAATGGLTAKTDDSSSALETNADRINGVRDALKKLTDQINADNDANVKAISTKAQFVEGLGQLKAAVKENGNVLDLTSKKGLANSAMLGDLASDAQAAAQAQYELDQKTMGADEAAKKYSDNLATQKKRLEDAAVAAGFSKDEVKKLLDTVLKLPDTKSIQILADTQKANDALSALRDRFNNTTITVKARIKAGASNAELGGLLGIGVLPGSASGGLIPGAPSSVDNRLSPVATGEFIVKASQVTPPENRRVLEYINAGGRMRGYADGGFVQPQYASTSYRPSMVAGPGAQTNVNVTAYGADGDEIARSIMREQRRALVLTGATTGADD